MATYFSRWQSDLYGFPRYKSQHKRGLSQDFSIYFTNQQVKLDWKNGKFILPNGLPALKVRVGQLRSGLINIGVIRRDSNLRLMENEYFEVKLQNVTLKLEGSEFTVSLSYKLQTEEPVAPDNNSAVGIDRGVVCAWHGAVL